MRKREWLRWIFILSIILIAASAGLSRMLRTSAARRFLIAHLEASFGRPVEVGRFDFSLLDGARLEANSFTILEEPRFGHEYFLRADTLGAGLRWSALLFGRFEFGRLSLSRPSLNLARDAQGRWNIEQWLPPAPSNASHPGFIGPISAPRSPSTARLYRIDVEGGRINFKQGDDKSPLALVGVSGRVDQDAAGRWALDLEAQPMRAGIELQQIGTLRVRGYVAGTTARLQPAELSLTWRDVSLADALRLSRASDFGVRGALAVDISARVAPPNSSSNAAATGAAQWSISGVARLIGFHGWKLPGHTTDPKANFSFDAAWRLGEARTQIPKFLIETPYSHLEGAGELDWTHELRPQVHFDSSTVGFADVLSWYRALLPGVPANLDFAGTVGVNATLGGWPLQLEQGAFASAGGRLTGASLPAPLKVGAMNVSISRGAWDFAPAEISFIKPPAASGNVSVEIASVNSFTLRGTIFPDRSNIFLRPPNWNFSIEGVTPRLENWLAVSESLAHPLNTNWIAKGGLAVKMRAIHGPQSSTVWLGTIDSRDLDVTAAYLNQPLLLHNAHLEFTPSQRTLTLISTQAFGAMWHGTAVRKNTDGHWTFDIFVDHLDAAELDRWLGPRARPGLLARFTGAGKSTIDTSGRDAAVAGISALGRLRIAEIELAPFRFEQFDGEAELAGRTITIHNAQADFFGGKVAGTFDARLIADPSYQFQGRFDRVDLARLGHATAWLTNRIAGSASAAVTISAHGVGHQNLVRSIEGDGRLDARNVEISGLDFARPLSANNQDPTTGWFSSVQGNFRIGGGGIEVMDFNLDNSQGSFRTEGRIDFSHALNLRIHPSIFHTAADLSSAPPPNFLLGGTIEAPSIVLGPASTKTTAKSSGRAR